MAENKAAYSYEAALKQLNIDPQTVSLRTAAQQQMQEERVPQYFLPDLTQVDSQLQQLSSKKIQKLESLIQQHTSTISALQSDLAVSEQSCQSYQEQASQLESLVAQYESRFAQVRNILEQKEFELASLQDEVKAANQQIQTLHTHTSDLSSQLQSAHDTIKQQQAEHSLEMSHFAQQHDTQLAKLKQAHTQELSLCQKKHDAEKIRLAHVSQQDKDEAEEVASELRDKLSAQMALLARKEVDFGFCVQVLEQKVEAQARALEERQKSQNESILESHIEKLRQHIQELQSVNCSLDQQNQQLTLQIQHSETARVQCELKEQEASFKLQQQVDLLKLQTEEQQLAAKQEQHLLQSQHEVALRQKQRDLDSAQSQIKRLNMQLHELQSQCHFDSQTLHQRWQDKYNDLKEQVQASNDAQQQSLEHERELRDALRQLRFEHKTATKALLAKDSEIAALQSKYEQIIESKESELSLHRQCSKEAEDKLRFEIEYLKKLEPKTAEKPAMIPAEEVPFRVSGGSNQFKRDVQPSPYVQAFLKSTFKHQQSLNDSLDKLQREFMQGYNEAMMLSDAKLGDLATVQVSSQGFKQENEALRDRIQQMRVDMDAMMTKVKDELQTKPQDTTQYKQKIADLEALLRQAECKVARLSEERDQLCLISAELRAELNRQQRLIADMMTHTPKSPARVDFGGEEPKTMFDDNLRFSQASHEYIISYGKKLTEIAGELQELAKQQQSPTRVRQQSPQRPLQVLTKSPGKSRSRSPVNRHLAQIREIRKNLEVEGQALQGFYKQQRQDELIRQSQTEKQTKSQLSAANRLLQAQNKKLKDKQTTRQEMIKNAQKQGVRNYAVQDDLPVDFGATVSSDIGEVRQDSPSPQDVEGGLGVRYHQDDHNMLMNIGNYAMREEKPQTAAAGRSRQQSRSPDDLVSLFGAKRQQSAQKPSPQRSKSRSNNGGRKTKEKVRDYRIAGARPLSHTKIEGAELII